jgi:hypothetical protein
VRREPLAGSEEGSKLQYLPGTDLPPSPAPVKDRRHRIGSRGREELGAPKHLAALHHRPPAPAGTPHSSEEAVHRYPPELGETRGPDARDVHVEIRGPLRAERRVPDERIGSERAADGIRCPPHPIPTLRIGDPVRLPRRRGDPTEQRLVLGMEALGERLAPR